jgi:hypothetical protein
MSANSLDGVKAHAFAVEEGSPAIVAHTVATQVEIESTVRKLSIIL